MSKPDYRKVARRLTADLVPHVTSVHNVDLISSALEDAYQAGANAERDRAQQVANEVGRALDKMRAHHQR